VSKLLYTESKWKAHSRRRQLAELDNARRWREHLRKRRVREPVIATSAARTKRDRPLPKYRPHSVRLVAPEQFSLVSNPDNFVKFLNLFEQVAENHNIFLDLSGVKQLTSDAVAALIATMKKDSIQSRSSVRGNQPTNPKAREVLAESGFFDLVATVETVPARRGLIRRRDSRKVEPLTARDLVHRASEALTGESCRCRPAYSTLIECMNNTHNHAAGGRDFRETWWATVYADEERLRACYTFIDTGVGIFRSVKIKVLGRFFKAVGISNNAAIMREILLGRVESSTGQHYRGKGLPELYKKVKAGRISRLIIVANNVFADVGIDEFRQMRTGFKGTIVYWET
jgi:hypothetical protein